MPKTTKSGKPIEGELPAPVQRSSRKAQQSDIEETKAPPAGRVLWCCVPCGASEVNQLNRIRLMTATALGALAAPEPPPALVRDDTTVLLNRPSR